MFLVYFLGGLFILPQGNFNVLGDIHSMYLHCKSTEDKDLTPLDFLTDHLLDLDCIFDPHNHGDEQKPHVPIPFNYHLYQNTFVVQEAALLPRKPALQGAALLVSKDTSFCRAYHPDVFRPPVWIS